MVSLHKNVLARNSRKSFALILILTWVAFVGPHRPRTGTVPLSLSNVERSVKSEAGKPVVDVRGYGVVGDGRVAVDCSISSGSAIVTCSTAHFVAGDVGKSVGMWGAGPTVLKAPTSYVTALSTTIASYRSATEITLATSASNTANPSIHLVWGTNNYTAINTAIATANALHPTGYSLFFPAGYYLTPTIDFPCGAIGTFGAYVCKTATKNLTISGASVTSTVIENFKADRGFKGGPAGECGNYFYVCGLIMFGSASTSDGTLSDSTHWVNGVTIHDITLIEVQNGNGNYFNEPENIALHNTSGSEVYNTNVQWSSYMCIAGGAEPAYIHDNYAYHCGWGGPAYSATNSAINVVVPNSKITRNRIYYSAQGVEGGAPNQEISYNFAELDDGHGSYPPATVSPKMCLNIGSSTYGMWNTHVIGNTCVNWSLGPANGGAGGVGNGSGIMSDMVIENNKFINSGQFSLGYGLEGQTSGWPGGENTTHIHGTSIFRNNSFRFDKDVTVGAQGLGLIVNSRTEMWTVDGVDILLPGNASNCNMCAGLVLQGSFPAWQPSTTYTQSANSPSMVQPPMPNGFYYALTGTSGTCVSGATVPVFRTTVGTTASDNTCTWKNAAAKPIQSISNVHVSYPPASTNGTWAIQNQGLLSSDVIFSNITASGNSYFGIAGIGNTVNGWNLVGFPLEYWAPGDDATPSTTHSFGIRDTIPFASYNRTSMSNNVLPIGTFYRAGDVVLRLAAVRGASPGWLVVSDGWRGKTWVETTSYPYNAMVQASRDNGHVFIATDAAGCSSGTHEPTWQTGAGVITNDNAGGGTCHWKESGASAQFATLPVS